LKNVLPNGTAFTTPNNQRYGISVSYTEGKFIVASGTTGDESSLAITNVSGMAQTLLGMEADGHLVEAETSQINNLPAVRGQLSSPAVVTGNQMGVDPRKSFLVNTDNQNVTVIVDGISAQIQLTEGQYSIGTFTEHLQSKINLMADALGRSVSGVTVGFDEGAESLVITGATASDNSFIQVAGHADWGLEDIDAGFGKTSSYIELVPDTSGTSEVYVTQDNAGNWIETTDKADFDDEDIPYWTPIFLDKGELTFDTSGTLVSPIGGAKLESDNITGGSINLAYNNSTQFNSPFAVLSQAQNGAPEGDLVGVNIGDDGLVVASYSNGSQKSLGKIILANFATPKGLRQVGDTSYSATSGSGDATLGEPGAAGFGTIRAGARERSNVDLTAELVDLITAQRNFQANAKAIETSSSLTQTIINIRG
jgi:flagellar hook-basal body protein